MTYAKPAIVQKMLPDVIAEAESRTGIVLTTPDRSALIKIAYKESSYRPTAKSIQGSTAFGLYGFLNATWKLPRIKALGIKKTTCVWCQTEAALVYIKPRYGNPSKALRYHNINGNY